MNRNSFALCLAVAFLTAKSQNWLTTLNTGNIKFGTSSNHPLTFYTNSTLRMSLSAEGRFGIGTSEPLAKLHVVGDGLFSSNIKSDASLILKNNLYIGHTPATPTSPNIISLRAGAGTNPYFTPFTADYTFRSVCDVRYVSPPNGENPGSTNMVVFGPQTAILASDLIQISDPAQMATLNLGVLNGSGIIASEPIVSGTGYGSLKINPGCPTDVNICEGGGYTRIFNGADIRRGLKVFDYGIKNTVPLDGEKAFSVFSKDNNPAGDENFTIYGSGETYTKGRVGIGVQPVANTFVRVYDPVAAPGSNLLTLGRLGLTNVLNISVKGETFINANVTSTAQPVFRIINSNYNIFEVASNGVTYARDVIVTLNSFPDYVFSKDYKLMPIEELRDFISKNQRLPNMPAASDVENNGARLGEIQRLTVEKVEEMYLYMLEMEKKITDLNQEITLLKRQTAK